MDTSDCVASGCVAVMMSMQKIANWKMTCFLINCLCSISLLGGMHVCISFLAQHLCAWLKWPHYHLEEHAQCQ
jgi:hypothetical protein